MTPRSRPLLPLAAVLVLVSGSTAMAQRGFGNDMPPGGSGSFNPTGPSPNNPPGSIAPMPPGRGSINPTGPLPGAPPGYIHPMPPGGSGSFTPTGPSPQPSIRIDPNVSSSGANSRRRLPSYRGGGKAEVAPGLEPCLKGWNPKRGLTRKQHEATCLRIWKRRPADLD